MLSVSSTGGSARQSRQHVIWDGSNLRAVVQAFSVASAYPPNPVAYAQGFYWGIIGDGSDFRGVGSASLARFARHYPLRQSLPTLFFPPISIVVPLIRKNRDTFAGRVAGGDMPLCHVAKIAFGQQVWPAGMAG